MVDDDHTKTTDASACFDAYDPNNPTGEGEGGKLEKKPSQAKNKQQSGKKKGKGKKNKNTVSVQSVECQPPPDKEKVWRGSYFNGLWSFRTSFSSRNTA